MNLETIFFALLGGIIPALLWLDFWLHEDKKNPEPKGMVAKTFLFGMLAVVLVIPLQKVIEDVRPGTSIYVILVWAALEELLKFGAAWFGGLRSKNDNEPVDAIVYTVTAALGFVALENTLFILGPLLEADIVQGVITGNLRFIGASLLHVVTSGMIGSAYAFTFYKPRAVRTKAVKRIFFLAVAFHFGFNILILKLGGPGTAWAFLAVWTSAIALLWAFEKAKSVRSIHTY